MLASQRLQITRAIEAAVAPLVAGTALGTPVVLERPKIAAHGDVACNVAMQIAKPLKRNPREVASSIIEALANNAELKSLISTCEIAGPGFINMRLAPAARNAVVAQIMAEGERFGCIQRQDATRTVVEFVSANPTGPLHVGHGRQAALGDVLVALLRSQGFDAAREFYYNDGGAQIANLTASVAARIAGHAPGDAVWPEDAYKGEYVTDIARAFMARESVAADDRSFKASGDPADLDGIRQFAVAYLRHEQDLDLRAFGVKFDNYYLESSLYGDGHVDATVAALVKSGHCYESEGALWLRTTEYGDDKDRVMRRSDGTYTYFVPDVAYHVEKWRRGYARAITILGYDHFGSLARVHAGLQAVEMGIPKGYPDYVLHKMVKVMRGGEEVKISKRDGQYVMLRDLVEWAGRDAVRFFLVSRKAETEFVFDIDLAVSQSDENPVYYVQMAHARISSVLVQWQEREAILPAAGEEMLRTVDLSALTSAHEAALLQRLAEYPDVLANATEELAPYQLANYLRECAADLHSYYNAERVLVDDLDTRHARLALMLATRQVLRNGLNLLGVSTPERMDRQEEKA